MSTRVISGTGASHGEHICWRKINAETPAGQPQPTQEEPVNAAAEEARSLRERLAALEHEAATREQSALRAGLEQGRAAGEREAAARLDAIVERFTAAVHELSTRRKQLRHEAERDVVKLSIAIARRVLHRELNADPEALLGLVKAALEKLDSREVDRVRVHPADAASVRAQLERLRPTSHFEIVPDSSLERGAALFEGSRGSLDASVETQLLEIERGLTDRLSR
ncbi:MAG TPA: FliH/SctL family protein [Bryobacteraceae bacterium]|nr:FliH/SctL family protein [Bryobacteraceae bacterium]